jgi:hypothetical protein
MHYRILCAHVAENVVLSLDVIHHNGTNLFQIKTKLQGGAELSCNDPGQALVRCVHDGQGVGRV